MKDDDEKETEMEYEIADGQRVKGHYFGVEFTGTVEKSRGITVPPFPIQYTVKLDTPIHVCQRTTDLILVGNGPYWYNSSHIEKADD